MHVCVCGVLVRIGRCWCDVLGLFTVLMGTVMEMELEVVDAEG